MTHENENLLREMRTGGLCDYCRCRVPVREPHHVFSRGTGRLDLRITLASLCPAFFGQECHTRFHAGAITQEQMVEVVAKREGTHPGYIYDVVNLLRRLDHKTGGRYTLRGVPIAEELADLGEVRELAVRVLREMGVSLEEGEAA